MLVLSNIKGVVRCCMLLVCNANKTWLTLLPFLTNTGPEFTLLPGMLTIAGKSAREPALAIAITPLLAHTGNVQGFNWNVRIT